jgi:DNA-binding CsgD family transcriptional regulator
VIANSAKAKNSSLNSRIDSINGVRIENSAAAIQPLYDAFIEANKARMAHECARSLTYLAWSFYDNNQTDLSLQLFEYARNYCPEDDTELSELITLGIGASYSVLGINNDGEKILTESLKHSIKSGNKRESMMINLYLGAHYSKAKKESKAEQCFERARQLAHEINDTLFESAIYCNLGNYGKTTAESESLYNKSIDLCKRSDNKMTECHAYCNLAELYYNNNEYDKALRTLERANDFLPFLKDNDIAIKELHLLFSKIYSAQKDYTAAYNHSVRYSEQLQDEQQQLNTDRAKYRMMMKNIIRACETYNISTREIKYNATYRTLIAIIICISLILVIYIYFHRKEKRQAQYIIRKDREIKDLLDTRAAQDEELRNSKTIIKYLYIFYNDRNLLLEKISNMIKDGYKMGQSQLITHLKNTNIFINSCYNKTRDNKLFDDINAENQQFLERLMLKHELSEVDRQLAIYYRMGLSTKEISILTGKQPKTITMARYRLKKELGLHEETDLTDYLKGI